MIIDLQELIQYNIVSDFFDFDLSNQEILEISEGDYGAIWLTTQDYKIKYLPNNLVIYSKYDLINPLYFFPCDYFSLNYYSRIDKKEIADKYPSNTWVKYNDPDSYEYAMWTENENERKEYLSSYQIDNYKFTSENEKEISIENIRSQVIFNYLGLFFRLNNSEQLKKINKNIINNDEKLFLSGIFKNQVNSDKIFDLEIDGFGNIWLATGKRLIRFDGKKFFEIDIPAIALQNDLQNNLWIGTAAYNSFGSIIKFDGTGFTTYNSFNSPLPENSGVLDLYCDDYGNLWIALKRTGLPGKLDNINLAILNPSGVNFITSGLLQSINWVREPINDKIKSLYSDRMIITVNSMEVKPFSKIELCINDKIRSIINSGDQFPENGDLNVSYYLEKPSKYSIVLYLYDLIGVKREMAYFESNFQFNNKGFFLAQNEPNPFSNYTKIEYGYFEGRMVEIKILDHLLRQVDGFLEKYIFWIGKPYLFESEDLPNGIYSYYLKENNSGIVDVKRMVLFDPDKIITLPR